MKYIVQARKGSWPHLSEYPTREDAENEIDRQEAEDHLHGNYEQNYYEIIEKEE